MIKKYNEAVEINKTEVARYLGYGKNFPDQAVKKLIEEKINQLKCESKVCYLKIAVLKNENGIVKFDCFSVESRALSPSFKKGSGDFCFGECGFAGSGNLCDRVALRYVLC